MEKNKLDETKESLERNHEDTVEEEVKEEIKEEINEKDEDSKEKEDIDGLKEELAILRNSKDKLQKEVDTLKDRLLRTTAEYENYRKRTTKEKEGIYTDACEDILKEILPILDNLERAVEMDGSSEDIKKGIEITIKSFKDSLTKLNVEEIQADGEFDPNFHNAVMHVEDEKLENNMIAEVFQKGYKRGEKVIRYTMVKVAN